MARLPSYDQQNRIAAEIILADPQRYGGAEAFPCVWATLVLARLGTDAQGP